MTRSEALQEKLNTVYQFVADTVDDRGYPPTIREIAVALNIKSTSSVAYYLDKLEQAGKITSTTGKSRSIELIETEERKRKHLRDFVNVPLVGKIPAGEPKLAVELCDDVYSLPLGLFNLNGDLFMLKVDGTSMIEVGIQDGDYIIVKKQTTAENGQIVAAFVNNEYATVKRFYREKGYFKLHPENSTMKDIFAKDVIVLGIVVGLIRTSI